MSTTAGLPEADACSKAFWISPGPFHPNPKTSHGRGNVRDIYVPKNPNLFAVTGRHSAISAINTRLVLIQRVVVDQSYGIDATVLGCLQLAEEAPKTAVSCEADYRCIRQSAFRAQRCRKPPTQGTCTSQCWFGVFRPTIAPVQIPACPVSETRTAPEGSHLFLYTAVWAEWVMRRSRTTA